MVTISNDYALSVLGILFFLSHRKLPCIATFADPGLESNHGKTESHRCEGDGVSESIVWFVLRTIDLTCEMISSLADSSRGD